MKTYQSVREKTEENRKDVNERDDKQRRGKEIRKINEKNRNNLSEVRQTEMNECENNTEIKVFKERERNDGYSEEKVKQERGTGDR